MLMTTTPRAIRDDVKNILDYLQESQLALATNEVSMGSTRVGWHPHDRFAPLFSGRGHATVAEYLSALGAGHYSAVLYDASIIQMTFDIEGGRVTRHRLNFVPCPYVIDLDLLTEGEPMEVVRMYADDPKQEVALRSPVRFDYDSENATNGHPAAHLTINSDACRVACVAPMHAYRFIDFVFRHFHPSHHKAHAKFFSSASLTHLGDRSISDEDRHSPHISWRTDALAG
jgi:hypothetical protein